jgi:dTMP kinase
MVGSTPVFVVIEGNDGTGKSSIARLLAERLDAVLLATPPADLRPVRAMIDACYRDHGLSSQLFYASTVVWVSDTVRALLAQGRSVVVDRYWISTLVYNAQRSRHVDLAVVEPHLMPAHATVLIVTEEGERRRRITQRGATPADEAALEIADEINGGFARALARPIAGVTYTIDSTSHGPEECTDRIARWLGETETSKVAGRQTGF